MTSPEGSNSRIVPPVALVHQEGFLALIAVVGLSFTENGVIAGLAPRGALLRSLVVGGLAGFAGMAMMWLLRVFPAAKDLESWQQKMVRGWTATDGVVIALSSGVAEEALLRALLQPIIGLIPAAAVFALLHIVPDRRLWLWPVLALVLGLVLGVVFDLAGYPAAALAHSIINGLSICLLIHRRDD